jgi:hypothetical protein
MTRLDGVDTTLFDGWRDVVVGLADAQIDGIGNLSGQVQNPSDS